ncbi:unnamed protein product [Lota lota]
MTNVSSCYSNKTLSEIAYDYKTLVMLFLDHADKDLREKSTDCQESTSNPQNQAKRRIIKSIACKMQRLQVSFTDTLVEAVLTTGGCQCHGHMTRAPRLPSKRTRAKLLCKVKSLLTSMRKYYESVYTKSQLTTTPS